MGDRKNPYASLAHTNSGASSLELAGVVVDASSIYLVMSARATVKFRSVKVDGYQPHPEQIKPLATPDGRQYLVIVLPASPAMGKGFPFGFSVTLDGDTARHFDVSGAVQIPSGEKLIWREIETSQIAKNVQTKN